MSFLFVQMPKRIIRLNASRERCDSIVYLEVLRCYKFKIPSQIAYEIMFEVGWCL